MAVVGVCLLAFYAVVAAAGYRLLALLWQTRPAPGMIVVIVGGLTLLSGYLSYRFGTARLLSSLDAVELPRGQAPTFHQRLDRLCTEYEIDRPHVLVAALPTPNAFALGGARGGTLVLDRSLLRVLGPDELEGILAHELAHLESYDALVQTLAYSTLRTLTGAALLLLFPFLLVLTGFARATAWMGGRPGAWSATPFGQLRYRVEQSVLVGLSVLTLVLLARSRRREFAADDRAASVTGDPLALARALRKIQRYSEPRWGLLSLLSTSNDEDDLTRLLATHPATEERVERLTTQSEQPRSRVDR